MTEIISALRDRFTQLVVDKKNPAFMVTSSNQRGNVVRPKTANGKSISITNIKIEFDNFRKTFENDFVKFLTVPLIDQWLK